MQIYELPASSTIAATDLFVKETNDGTTQKLTGANLRSQLVGWTRVDRVQGTGAVDIPATANEYLIILQNGTSGGAQA